MEVPKEQCSVDTHHTEMQSDDISKTENVLQSVGNIETEGSARTGFITEEDISSFDNQSPEINKNIDESQSVLMGSEPDYQETNLELETGNHKFDEPESVQNVSTNRTNGTGSVMEVEIQSSSSNNCDQSSSCLIESRPDESSVENSSEKSVPSITNEDSNACEDLIYKNSALNVSTADEKVTASSSTCEIVGEHKIEKTVTKEKVPAPAEPTILCNSNALNALWGYGILISSDEGSDEDDQLPGPVVKDFSGQRQSVAALDSDSSLSSSTSLFFTDDSGSDDEQVTSEKNKPSTRPKKPLMTDGELALEDLPAIEDLQISVPENDCTKVGEILHVIDRLVVVQGIKGMPPLDLDTALFLSWDRPLGLVFDVFGPVVEPSYCVRFNSNEEIKVKNITPGMPVYFGPKSQYTNYVFMQHLLNSKGSDASWTGNNEPPLEQLDFSDDEAERAAKQAIRAINREIKADPDEPQRKKHMAYEQRMNAMNLYMSRVSEMKSQALQRKRRPAARKEGSGRVIRPAILTSAASSSGLPQPIATFEVAGRCYYQPAVVQSPFHGAVALPPTFAQPPPFTPPCPAMVNFNRFVPPPPPAALPKPSMFVDTSVPPPCSPQPALLNNMAFPPPTMSVPPPTATSPASSSISPFFCNMNLPPPPQPAAFATSRLFRSSNSVNLNSLFPDLFVNSRTQPPPLPPAAAVSTMAVQQSPVTNPSFSFPPPPLALATPAPAVVAQPLKDNTVANSNRLPVFNQSTFHNPIHRPATPTPPPYSLFINKA